MRKVKFKDVTNDHLQTLQTALLSYAQGFTDYLKRPSEQTDFIYSVTQVDIANTLWRKFRTKVESGVQGMRFSITASEATILLNACNNAAVLTSDPYTANVARIYKNEIDHQLTSYNTVYLIQQ